MFQTYILPIIIFAVLGIIAGVLLAVASRVFYVRTDERIEKISEILPQANCGSCGYAGCADYANAIVNDNVPTNLCRPGGMETNKKICEILGTDADEMIDLTAFVHCNGSCGEVKERFKYEGVISCSAAKRLYGGAKACIYGCIGYGDCVRECEKNAIEIVDGTAVVNGECIACGKCVKACPNGLITLKPANKHTAVKCSSCDSGKNTRLVCSSGCIGCKICEKKCESKAIRVIDFHAVIDYNKCTDCGSCYTACPVKAIQNVRI